MQRWQKQTRWPIPVTFSKSSSRGSGTSPETPTALRRMAAGCRTPLPHLPQSQRRPSSLIGGLAEGRRPATQQLAKRQEAGLLREAAFECASQPARPSGTAHMESLAGTAVQAAARERLSLQAHRNSPQHRGKQPHLLEVPASPPMAS